MGNNIGNVILRDVVKNGFGMREKVPE